MKAEPGTTARPVLHCIWNGETGGAERALYQLVREQLREPELAPAIAYAQGVGPYADQARQLGCPVIDLELPHGRALQSVPSAADKMRPFPIHHFHGAEPLLMMASLSCRGARRVYTHRGGILNCALRKRLQNFVVGAILRRSFHALSANTSHAAHCATELFGIDPSRIDVTYNGLYFDALEPARPDGEVRRELGLPSDAFVLGTAANLTPWKRIERLLVALQNVRDRDLRVLIVGHGVERLRLESLAIELHVDDRVVFAGLQSHVGDYLQLMDAFCLPATAESFGNAAVEAMGMAVPTIIFADGGGLLEHIEPGESGFVVRDQSELEGVLRDLLCDRTLGREIGARGRAAVRERYTPERAVRGYRALYAKALLQVPASSTESWT